MSDRFVSQAMRFPALLLSSAFYMCLSGVCLFFPNVLSVFAVPLLGPPVTLAWRGLDDLSLYLCQSGIFAATAGLAYAGWRTDTSGIWVFWAFVSLFIWLTCGVFTFARATG